MSITLDFLLLFFLFIIPGLVFKRVFFFKEFSKQFSIKDNSYPIIFFSFIPGLLFQVVGFFIYWIAHEPDYSLHDILISLKGAVNKKESLVPIDLNVFIIHQFLVNLLAGFSGFLISRLIRYCGLDIKYKFFRFSNQWYYIFSGEIESFEKFKKFNSRVGIDIMGNKLGLRKPNEFKHYPPVVDILTEGSEGQKLYSGFLIDYDLNPKDIHSLDKVYLKHAFRYRPKKDEDSADIIKGNTARVPIKGDVFVLNTDNLVNMNVTFIPTPKKVTNEKEEKKKKWFKWLYKAGVFINIYVLFDLLFLDMFLLRNIFLDNLTNEILSQPWYVRIFISTVLNLLVSLGLPFKDEKTNQYTYQGAWRLVIAKLVLMAVFYWLSYYFWT